MTDIVERLRNTEFAFEPPLKAIDLMEEAADEITRLRAENEKLRAALEGSQKRFATLKAAYDRERKKPVLLYGSAALQQEPKP